LGDIVLRNGVECVKQIERPTLGGRGTARHMVELSQVYVYVCVSVTSGVTQMHVVSVKVTK